MAMSLKKLAFHLTLLLALLLIVSSCGRRGDLEAPGAVQSNNTKQLEQTTQDDVDEVKQDKPFILDPLL